MTHHEDQAVAQPRNVMFERNVGHAASRGREVRIIQKVGAEVVGFCAGLDEGWLQICNTSDQTLEMIDRENIASFKETGNTLNDYERDESFDKAALSRIRQRVEHFQKRTSFSFGRKSNSG